MVNQHVCILEKISQSVPVYNNITVKDLWLKVPLIIWNEMVSEPLKMPSFIISVITVCEFVSISDKVD